MPICRSFFFFCIVELQMDLSFLSHQIRKDPLAKIPIPRRPGPGKHENISWLIASPSFALSEGKKRESLVRRSDVSDEQNGFETGEEEEEEDLVKKICLFENLRSEAEAILR